MRKFLLAAVMFGAASGAQAADMPDFLRGSISAAPLNRNWDGWYVGGQIDYTSANIDLSHAPQTLTNFMLRNSVIQGPVSQLSLFSAQHAQATGFGAFVGRNFQWDDLVFGIEANYVYLNSLSTSARNQLARRFDNPNGQTLPPGHTDRYDVTLSGTASLQVKDVVTFRGRAGWATGNFLPYVFGGVAVGRMDVSRSVTSTVTRRDDVTTTDIFGNATTTIGPTRPVPAQSQTLIEQRTNAFVAGWTAGLGMEYMLWGNLFMRGEWEYVKFLSVKNTVVQANNLRAAIGYKF